MKLRSFATYGATNCVVHAALTPGIATAIGITTPLNLCNVDGYFRGAVASWLQIHDAASLPADTAVPLKSFPLTAGSPFPSIFETLGPITLVNGCVLAISTTEATLTISTELGDFLGEVEEFDSLKIGLTSAGDFTTGRSVLSVWTNGSGPKRIYRAYIKNNTGSGTVIYAQIFPITPTAGDIPLMSRALTDAVWTVLRFGSDGYIPYRKTSAGVDQNGCRLVFSTTADVFTAVAGTPVNVKAFYQ